MGEYEAWDMFFRALEGAERRLTFDELEALTNVELPPSARSYASWWSRSQSHAIWDEHGWRASPLIAEGAVVFRRSGEHREVAEESSPHPIVAPLSADAILVGCVATKRDTAMAAKDLYTSALWDRRRSYAEATGKPWAILSSEYGLVQPDDVIEPYDRYMGDQSLQYRQHWSGATATAVGNWCREIGASSVEIHAGKNYVSHGMESGLRELGIDVSRPLAHHRQGEQLAWYDAQRAGIVPTVRSPVEVRDDSSSETVPLVPAGVSLSFDLRSPERQMKS